MSDIVGDPMSHNVPVSDTYSHHLGRALRHYRTLLVELEALADKADQPEYREFGVTPTELRRLVKRETPTD